MISKLFASLCVFASLIGVANAQVTNGKVTTAAPAYTNGNISPLSLDTSGNLRTSGAVTGTVTANAYGKATTAVPSYVNNTDNPLSLDLAGNLRASILTAIPAGSAIIGKVGIDQTTPGTTNGVQINAAIPAGNNNIGDVDIATMPNVTIGAVAQTGTTVSATTAASVIKASAGTLYSVVLSPTSVAAATLSIYDNASACSGTVRFAALVSSSFGAGGIVFMPPISFSNGITVCSSTGTASFSASYN